MKPRIRAYSLKHYQWHYEQAKFNVEYYKIYSDINKISNAMVKAMFGLH